MKKVILTLMLLSSAASAQPAAPAAPSYPIQVSTQDQQSLRQICALAQKDATLTLEQATGVGQYCLGLISRIGIALSTHSAKAPATGEKH